MTKEDILQILTGKTPPEENLFRYIKRLSLEDITYILDTGKDKFRDFFSVRQNEFAMLFIRLRKLIPRYESFAKYINTHLLPTLEFYEFASSQIVFYESNTKPSIFFSHITRDTWNELLYNSDYPELAFNNIKKNVIQMLYDINPDCEEEEIKALYHDMQVRIYGSKLKFFDADSVGEYIYGFNLSKKAIKPKEISAFSSCLEMARFSDLILPFMNVYSKENEFVSSREAYQILNNYLAISGVNFAKANKFILSIASIEFPNKEKYLEYFIKNYEKLTGISYPFKKYDNQNKLDSEEIVRNIMTYYIDGLITGRISKADAKIMICDLINADYENDELNSIIKMVEEVLFQNRNEYLLLYYQSLLTQRTCYDKSITIEDIRYSPVMDEDGRYDQTYKNITYYLFYYAMDEPEEIIPTAIEAVNHEMRHAYQDTHMHSKVQIPSLLNDLESIICNKPSEGKSIEEEYAERYDNNYFESDARVYGFFATYKKLRQLSAAGAEKYFVESTNDDPVISKAARTYLASVRERLNDNITDMKSVERFYYLLTELYARFDVDAIAHFRKFSASLNAITKEDGTLLSLREIRDIIENTQTPHLRYFYINYAKKYEACLGKNAIFQNDSSINR